MTRYFLARLIAVLPTVAVLLFFVVLLVRLIPGSAIDLILQDQVQATEVDRSELEERLGLDKPLLAEFGDYFAGMLHGDLGKSVWSRQPVADIVFDRMWVTLELSVMAMFIAIVFGVTVGVLSAVYQNSWIDYILRSIAILGLSIPTFAVATLVIVFPTLWWHWSPPLFYTPASEGLWSHISQFFAPAAILGAFLSASIMRMTRTMMLEALAMDYIRTARAKGLAGHSVILRHALRNAMIPVVSLMGVQVAFLLSGSVIIENIFGLPGLGKQLITSIAIRDYPVIQGITVVTGLFVVLVNLLVDFSYAFLDPRTRAR